MRIEDVAKTARDLADGQTNREIERSKHLVFTNTIPGKRIGALELFGRMGYIRDKGHHEELIEELKQLVRISKNACVDSTRLYVMVGWLMTANIGEQPRICAN
jgi:hypothetical protein